MTIYLQEHADVASKSELQLEARKSADMEQQQLQADLEQFRSKICFYEEQITRLEQDKVHAVKAQEDAEKQMRMASEMVEAVQRSRDEAILKEKEALLQVAATFSRSFSPRLIGCAGTESLDTAWKN